MAAVCRVCIVKAVKCTTLSTKIEISSNLSFLDFLNKCTNLNVCENDKLPQSLCSLCANSLKKFYSFVKLAEQSNIILRETWKSLLATETCNNGRISYGKVTITKGKIEEKSEDFNKEDSFHCQPSENPTGSSLYILDIEKEESRVSESTSTVNFKDVEINESENTNYILDQPEGSLEEFVSARRLMRIDADHIDFENNIPITLLKRRLAQIEDGIDWNPSNMKKKTGKTRAKCKEATNEEAPGPQNIPCSGGLIDNNEFPCEEIAIKNEKIEEESEVFRKENSFHCQTNENSSEPSFYILDIEKEEACISDGTSIVDSKDPEIKERERSKSNIDQPEGHIEESEDILSYIDDYLTNIFAEHSDSKDNAPITLMKRGLNKNENNIDVQNYDDQSHCNPSNVKEKTSKSSETSTESEEVIIRRASVPKRIFTTEVLRYKCTICGKSFNLASSRSKHMESHGYFAAHMVNKKKCEIKNKCQQCDKEFKNSRNLKQHMKLHTNSLKCEKCGKLFTEKYQFNLHMENHKRIKWKCQQCDKEFKNSHDLHGHMKSHGDPKPFKCKNCGKFLSSKANYLRHMEICQPVGNSVEEPITIEESSLGVWEL